MRIQRNGPEVPLWEVAVGRIIFTWTHSRIIGQVGIGTHFTGNRGRLRRSTQHLLEVYSQEFEILEFFLGADLTAAPLCPDPLAYSRTGQFS